MQHLAQFTSDVRSVTSTTGDAIALDDGYLTPSFQKTSWRELTHQFRDVVLAIKPKIGMKHDSDSPQSNVVDLISDDEESIASSTPMSRKRPLASDPDMEHQRQRQRLSESPTFRVSQYNGNGMKRENGLMQAPPTPRFGRSAKNDRFANTPFRAFSNLGSGFSSLSGIRQYINKHSNIGHPAVVDIRTYNELILQSVNPWNDVLKVFIEETFTMVQKQVFSILHKHLGMYEQTELYKAASRHLNDFLAKYQDEQRKSLQYLYDLEHYNSFTMNKPSVDNFEAKELELLKASRRLARATAFVEHQIRVDPKKKFPADISKEDRDKAIKKRIIDIKDEQLGVDPFKHEIEVAAYIRGYYLTAAHRFIDNVSLSMQGKFFRDIRENIYLHLEQKLGILGSRDSKRSPPHLTTWILICCRRGSLQSFDGGRSGHIRASSQVAGREAEIGTVFGATCSPGRADRKHLLRRSLLHHSEWIPPANGLR